MEDLWPLLQLTGLPFTACAIRASKATPTAVVSAVVYPRLLELIDR